MESGNKYTKLFKVIMDNTISSLGTIESMLVADVNRAFVYVLLYPWLKWCRFMAADVGNYDFFPLHSIGHILMHLSPCAGCLRLAILINESHFSPFSAATPPPTPVRYCFVPPNFAPLAFRTARPFRKFNVPQPRTFLHAEQWPPHENPFIFARRVLFSTQ